MFTGQSIMIYFIEFLEHFNAIDREQEKTSESEMNFSNIKIHIYSGQELASNVSDINI